MNGSRFASFAWGVLGYNLLVVLWGAFVRITGSGAGCGSHWPLCNGTVVPRSAQVETLIEFTHRLTSGLALLAVVGLLVWAVRAYPRGHHVRLGASLSMAFMVLEALLGAGLVLFGLVDDNASTARALAMMAHLVNTFILIGFLALTAWWASGGAPVRLRGQGAAGALLALSLLGMLLTGASGAVAALGNTLFPSSSLAEGLRADFSPTAHVLIRLRIFHPLIAIGTGLFTLFAVRLVQRLRPGPATRRGAALVSLLVVTQLAIGTINVALLAPAAMQLVHLLFADLLWIATLLFGAAALAESSQLPAASSQLPARQDNSGLAAGSW